MHSWLAFLASVTMMRSGRCVLDLRSLLLLDTVVAQNAIRHNLSVKPCFVRDKHETEKGSFWRVDHNVDPGKGRPRQRKRWVFSRYGQCRLGQPVCSTKKIAPAPPPSVRPPAVPPTFEAAKGFAESLVTRPAGSDQLPTLSREYALGFDRHIASRALEALTTMVNDPVYTTGIAKQRERMRGTVDPSEQVFTGPRA